jgi:hypothetical protein
MDQQNTTFLIKIYGIIAIVLVLFGAVLYFLTRTNSTMVPATPVGETPTPFPIIPGEDSSNIGQIPVTSTTTASSTPLYVPAELYTTLSACWYVFNEYLVGTSTHDYTLSYSARHDEFRSTIMDEPSAEYRRVVEDELRNALNLSDEEICALPVHVHRRTELTGQRDFQRIGLSFCPGSVSDEELLLPYQE